MKTTDQLFDEINDCMLSKQEVVTKIEKFVKERIEFANRFIPVEEELPELTTGDIHNAVNVKFITIHREEKKCTAVLEPITRHSGEDSPVDFRWFVYPSIGYELKTVTHWRPID
jgi:hypothetical protein